MSDVDIEQVLLEALGLPLGEPEGRCFYIQYKPREGVTGSQRLNEGRVREIGPILSKNSLMRTIKHNSRRWSIIGIYES